MAGILVATSVLLLRWGEFARAKVSGKPGAKGKYVKRRLRVRADRAFFRSRAAFVGGVLPERLDLGEGALA